MTSRLIQGLLDLLYPPRCVRCLSPSDRNAELFCARCHSALFHAPQLRCPRCAAVVGPYACHDGMCGGCRPQPPAFDATICLGSYERWHDLVLQMKQVNNQTLAERLGNFWAEEQRARFVQMKITDIVPVPLHWWSWFRRGYNQSCAIARGLSCSLGIPCRKHWLYRIRYTVRQSSLETMDRRDNVRGAFAVAKKLKGAHVLLVDDVMTTTATARECARTLKNAGAGQVSVAVIARA